MSLSGKNKAREQIKSTRSVQAEQRTQKQLEGTMEAKQSPRETNPVDLVLVLLHSRTKENKSIISHTEAVVSFVCFYGSLRQRCEASTHSCTTERNEKCFNHSGKWFGDFLKHGSAIWSRYTTPGYLPRKNKAFVYPDLFPNVESLFLHNSPSCIKWECPLSDEWKGRFVFSYKSQHFWTIKRMH